MHLQICPDSALYAVPSDANLVQALLAHSEERVQGEWAWPISMRPLHRDSCAGLSLGYATPPLTHVQDAPGAPLPPLATVKSMLVDKAEAGKYVTCQKTFTRCNLLFKKSLIIAGPKTKRINA